MASSKKDLRREETRTALIEAAEFLFAAHGIEAVSLRQIGSLAGSLNTNVVGYHFGSKEALIEAIYNYRLPVIDARREELLQAADDANSGNDCLTLVRAIWLPVYEQTSKNNQHTYARFLSSISRDGLGWTREALNPQHPTVNRIVDRLSKLPGVHISEFNLRMKSFMMVGALEYIDLNFSKNPVKSQEIFEKALEMAAAILKLPAASEGDGE